MSLGRPLHLPRLAKGAPCRVSHGEAASKLGRGLARMPVAGTGPVYLMSVGDDPAGSLGIARADLQGWRGQKAPWIASPRYRGPILIRGARIDGRASCDSHDQPASTSPRSTNGAAKPSSRTAGASGPA
jgi:hypothetical protein